MEKYQARYAADAMLQTESFTRLEWAGVEYPLYKYRDKSDINMITARRNISHDAQCR